MAGLEAKDVLLATVLGGASGGGGGANNYVTGTFTTGTDGANADVDTGYKGDGWMVSLVLYPVGGAKNLEGETAQQAWVDARGPNTVGLLAVTKSNETMRADDSQADTKHGTAVVECKASSSSATSLETYYYKYFYAFSNANPGATKDGFLKVHSETRIVAKVKTAGSETYGLAPGVEYRFHAIYSE